MLDEKEKARKEQNNEKRKADNYARESEAREKTKADAAARLERVVKKVGKKEMACSNKPKMKVKVVEKKKDPETED